MLFMYMVIKPFRLGVHCNSIPYTQQSIPYMRHASRAIAVSPVSRQQCWCHEISVVQGIRLPRQQCGSQLRNKHPSLF